MNRGVAIPQTNSREKPTDMYGDISNTMRELGTKGGIGIHAVRREKVNGQPVSEILDNICKEGLDIKNGSSVLATVSSLGISEDLKRYQIEEIENYRLGSEVAKNGVVVLVPTILEGNGERLFVGFPGFDTTAIGNNHKTTCILDQLCCGGSDCGKFPKEFILGSFTEENGKRKFQRNSNHFSEMTDEEKGKFIKSLSDRLTLQQKQISEAVIAKDMSKLEQLSLDVCGNTDGVIGENTVIQNAMFYLKRELEELEQKNMSNTKGKHMILLNGYRDAGVTKDDLKEARTTIYDTMNKTIGNRERTCFTR